MRFSPKINRDDFSTFWSTGTAWGIYTQKRTGDDNRLEGRVEVLYGELKDVEIVVDQST